MKTFASPLRFVLTLSIIFLFISIPVKAKPNAPGHPSPENSLAYLEKENHWKAFRQLFPYHIQTIALSERKADSSLVVIIAEPPPHAKIADIKNLFKRINISFEERQHSIGYDGWVKDILCVVSGEQKSSNLKAALLELHQYLFFTDYKSDFFYLERPNPSPNEAHDWNKALVALELKSWMNGEEQFFPYSGGRPKPIVDIVNAGENGIYFSQKPGLVVWVLPCMSDISSFKDASRIFAIDSDLILGAVSNKKNIAIIARERVNELWTLPPLRTETIMMLAAAKKFELGQSYERGSVFAGKFDNVNDWAPIYLSDELKNGEFGSLLNITDQLLKSWSLNGTVRYNNFESYPDPATWCFEKPITEMLEANALTFNWNTNDMSYALPDGNIEYYAVVHTGALPVSYIPEENDPSNKSEIEAIKPFEARATECFGFWEDPNLVRVMQYTALFQIFRNYHIVAETLPTVQQKSMVVENEVRNLLDILANWKPSDSEKLAVKLAEKSIRFDSLFPESQKEGVIKTQADKYLQEFTPITSKVKKGLNDLKSEFGESGYSFIVNLIADRNYRSNYSRKNAAINLLNTFYGECLFLLGELADKASIKDKLSESLSKTGGPWIKTPSLVVSRVAQKNNSDESGKQVIMIGGHNISMKYPLIQGDPSISPGDAKLIKDGHRNKLLLNPEDLLRISRQLVRYANQDVEESDMAQLTENIKKLLAKTPIYSLKPRNAVIQVTEKPIDRGYCPLDKRPKLNTEVQSPVTDILSSLSKLICSNLLIQAKTESSVLGSTKNHGALTLVKYSGLLTAPEKNKNTVYVTNEDFEKIKDFESVKSKMLSFFDLLPENVREKETGNGFYIQTIKETSEDILVLHFRIDGQLSSIVYRLSSKELSNDLVIRTALEKARNQLGIYQVCWFGTEVQNSSIYRIASQYGIEIFRRSPNVETEIPALVPFAHPLGSHVFEPKSSVICNYIPNTKEAVEYSGFSTANVSDWNKFHQEIAEKATNDFRNKPLTTEQFQQELIHGTSDVLLLVAHSNKLSVYVNDKKIEIEDIKTWEARQIKSNKPRIAILLSCYAGEIAPISNSWHSFQSQRTSLTEVFLQKKYFDIILSPDHQISKQETLEIMDEILRNPTVNVLRTLFTGWHAFVFTDNKKN
jgi:hypothetical protein